MENSVQLKVKDLHKTFDQDLLKAKLHVLRGVNLEVRKGDIYGFLGPNAAGKTTTIKSITGLIMPDSGEITIGGERNTSMAAKRKVGFMPEQPGFYNHLSGKELMRFYADLLAIPRNKSEDLIKMILDDVGLAGHASLKIRNYSKGMLQRLALAQALINDPELLILDEPMSGLDPIGRRDFKDIIFKLKERGTTIFFSSHIIPDVESLCDRVAILISGKIRAEGKVKEIVAMEVKFVDVAFSGVPLESIKTGIESGHESSDSTWVRVAGDSQKDLIEEISNKGGKLISLNPVRKSLEEVLISKYREENQ